MSATVRPRKFRWYKKNCYADAWRYASRVDQAATIVHGRINLANLAGAGIYIEHAWVEVDRGGETWCLDIHGERAQAEYGRFFAARAEARYSLREASVLMLEQGCYGPWHGHYADSPLWRPTR